MRRKSERTTTKKGKSSPEKKEKEKTEKSKRTRTSRRGRKQSSSSENESGAEDGSPKRDAEIKVTEVKPPVTPVKEPSLEEAGDQVWQVKSAQSSSESGEIQKLKICLKRPPSTPERVDRSPRSRRKHSRAASSSDTPSAEGADEKKKKHRSKRSARESKDSEKNHDSDEPEREQTHHVAEKADEEISQSTKETRDDTPMSTTEETKPDDKPQAVEASDKPSEDQKSSAADTTVASPKQTDDEQNTSSEKDSSVKVNDASSEPVVQRSERGRSPASVNQKSEKAATKEREAQKEVKEARTETTSSNKQVSKTEGNEKKEVVAESSENRADIATNGTDVVEVVKERKTSTDSNKEERYRSRDLERSESVQSAQEESKASEPSTPIVISRKRRWGRASKVTSQKSITISSDVLKEIIPDVKPVEFEEVIEEKKQHKRVETERPERSERFDRPVLPKIVIDNTDAIEVRDEKENVRTKELPLSNRKISIVKDNDDIITRPPSPPRHKQSCVLFISNLVRPFTLPQLKNLLQRTGRIAENGFWIDRIKSKCFVIYETEDQAVETRHALHGVTWPVSNPKTLQVDFSTLDAFENTKANENAETAPVSTIPGTVEDWLREQDQKRERGELEKPWERKTTVREWDVGKGDKDKEGRPPREEGRGLDRRRHRSVERSPEPARKFKKKEEEAPAKLLDDLFRKTKTMPCIYWLPLSADTIAVKEEQRRQHMAEHERRMSEMRRQRRP